MSCDTKSALFQLVPCWSVTCDVIVTKHRFTSLAWCRLPIGEHYLPVKPNECQHLLHSVHNALHIYMQNHLFWLCRTETTPWMHQVMAVDHYVQLANSQETSNMTICPMLQWALPGCRYLSMFLAHAKPINPWLSTFTHPCLKMPNPTSNSAQNVCTPPKLGR